MVGGQRHAPAALPPGKRPVTHGTGAGWAPGPVWTGVKNLAPTGIRSPDLPAGSEALYRLRYPGPYARTTFTPQEIFLALISVRG
jgi:hypothetical protein